MVAMMSVIALAPASRAALTVGLRDRHPELDPGDIGHDGDLAAGRHRDRVRRGVAVSGAPSDRTRPDRQRRDGNDGSAECEGTERAERVRHRDHLRLAWPRAGAGSRGGDDDPSVAGSAQPSAGMQIVSA